MAFLTGLKKLESPMYIALVAFVSFVFGLMISFAFRRREHFDQWSIPSTVAEFANGPKHLAAVPTYPYVTTHDDYYRKFGG